MGKIIDYTYRKFGSLNYSFAKDYPTKRDAEAFARGVRAAGAFARVSHEPNAAKARANKTGR